MKRRVLKRNTRSKPRVGDIVELTWHDAFLLRCYRENYHPALCKTTGTLTSIWPEGYAVAHTITDKEQPEDILHVPREIVRSIVVLRRGSPS
jgi:hypothetical protein